MANVKVSDVFYEDFSNSLELKFENKNIKLSENSKNLLKLVVESWFEDNPDVTNGNNITYRKEFLNNEKTWRGLMGKEAERILDRALEQDGEHLNGSVHFNDLMWALANTGRKAFVEFGFKRRRG